MLEFLQSLAQPIAWLARPALVLAALAGAVFVLSVLNIAGVSDAATIPAVAICIWGLAIHSFCATFVQVPKPADTDERSLLRVKKTFIRAAYWLIGALTIAVNVTMLYMTFRLVLIWLSTYNG